jgi:hypothetical protein
MPELIPLIGMIQERNISPEVADPETGMNSLKE